MEISYEHYNHIFLRILIKFANEKKNGECSFIWRLFLKGQSKLRGLVKQVAETAVASSDPDTEGELNNLQTLVFYGGVRAYLYQDFIFCIETLDESDKSSYM